MKIISYNIWDLPLWFVRDRKARFQALCKELREWDADIICLQEAFDVSHRAQLVAVFQGDYHTTINSEYRRVAWKKFDTTGGLVILSRFPIQEWTFHQFQHTGSPIEHLGQKGFLQAIVTTNHGPLQIINTHLNTHSFQSPDTTRLQQLDQLLSICSSGPDRIPTILAGDFNRPDLNGHTLFRDLLTAHGCYEPTPTSPDNSTTYHIQNAYTRIFFNRDHHEDVQLDYIFVRDIDTIGQPERYQRIHVPVPLSDHEPIELILTEK